jgi:hypothetical protein
VTLPAVVPEAPGGWGSRKIGGSTPCKAVCPCTAARDASGPFISTAWTCVADISWIVFTQAPGAHLRPQSACDQSHRGATYGDFAENVLQDDTVPFFNPVVNQRTRCSDEPCMKVSGTAFPLACF